MSELPPIQPSPPAVARRSRRNLALLLILAGGVILLVNSRLLGALVWDLLLPLVLICVGLDLVTEGRQRRRIGIAAVVGAITLAPLVGGVHFTGRGRMGIMSPMPKHYEVGSIENIEQVEVYLALTAGELSIDALPKRSDAVVSLGKDGGHSPSFSRQDRTGVVRIDHPLNAGDFDVQVTQRVPVKLTIQMGTGDLSALDLHDIQLAKLDIEQGAGNAEITLPDRGVMDISISSKFGDVEVDIPDELAARIEATTSFGDVDVDNRFRRENGVYLSDDYRDAAAHRATIRITTTAGTIRVR